MGSYESAGARRVLKLRLRGRRRNRTAQSELPVQLREELEQSQAWWMREYRALVAKHFPPKPFDPAEHDGHDLITDMSLTGPVGYSCAECPPQGLSL